MLLWFGLSLLFLLIGLGLVFYYQVRDAVVPLTKDLTQEVLVARSEEIGRLIKGYSENIREISQRNLIRRGQWEEIEADLLSRSQSISEDYEILFFADDQGNFITTTGAVGNVWDRDYFQAIMVGGSDSFVSDPMVSRSTGEDIFVVARVVINAEGKRIGLVAATILLDTFSHIVGSINIQNFGFGYVVDSTGLLIAHPNADLRMKLNFLESSALGYEGLEDVGRQMIQGESQISFYKRPDGSKLVTIFNPIPNTLDWSLGIALYEEELMGRIIDLMTKILLIMIAILLGVLFIIFYLSRKISSPIVTLKEGVEVISSGDLDFSLDIKTGDEIEDLANAFNRMTRDLKEYIVNLTRTTAEKERIEGELQIAHKIQTSMLPRTFPPYPDIEDLVLYATMEPAREVRGDFYDFFLLDNDRFCFSIGDVSGKGIPAALFMVITRTILKNLALQNSSLEEIFVQGNNLLCSENEECMFVTVFMGILHLKTGRLEYVNAGHNPPLISTDGRDFEYLDTEKNVFLGGFTGFPFKVQERMLGNDAKIFLYTDGVTEAMNEEDELFTDERMVQALNSHGDEDVKSIIQGVRKEISQFVLDTEASDDITMLALTLHNKENRFK